MKGAIASLAATMTAAIGGFLHVDWLICIGLLGALVAVDLIMSDLARLEHDREAVRRILDRERER